MKMILQNETFIRLTMTYVIEFRAYNTKTKRLLGIMDIRIPQTKLPKNTQKLRKKREHKKQK